MSNKSNMMKPIEEEEIVCDEAKGENDVEKGHGKKDGGPSHDYAKKAANGKEVGFAGEDHTRHRSHDKNGARTETKTAIHRDKNNPSSDVTPRRKRERQLSASFQPNSRMSLVTDLETGKKGGVRFHHALLRTEAECGPRSQGDRARGRIRNFFQMSKTAANETARDTSNSSYAETNPVAADTQDNSGRKISSRARFMVSARRLNQQVVNRSEDEEDGWSDCDNKDRQYRLEAIRPTNKEGWNLLSKLGFPNGQTSVYESSLESNGFYCCCGFNPNRLVVKYLHWSFRRSFIAVFLSAALFFFAFTMMFALPIYMTAQHHRTCIGGVENGGSFTDAYTLSWTTFSTVGYGLVYSGISSTEPERYKCLGMTAIVTFEAFVGMLFASMFGAILFAKVARVQSFAQVLFSDPMVIRFGKGLYQEEDEEDARERAAKAPPPVLEFRINNRLHSTTGGEIIDATVHIVASIDASQACPTVKNAVRRRRGRRYRRVNQVQLRAPLDRSALTSLSDQAAQAEYLQSLTKPKVHQAFEEDPSGRLVPRKIFSKLELESPDHPFLKRVWIVRHELNEHSPLLRAHARQMLRMNGGFWPRQLNTAEKVREAIHFDQILVSMSGTSNADANAVYAQKAYDFGDVCVGYRFADQLYRHKSDDSLRVDTTLISDITEQAGGGGEPLSSNADHDVVRASEMLVL